MKRGLEIFVNNRSTIFCNAEQLAKDLELFAQHAGRKSVNMEDVILSGKILMIIVGGMESYALN